MGFTVGELKRYIEENLTDATLTEDSTIEIENGTWGDSEIDDLKSMFNDCNTLKLSTVQY